MIPNGRASRLSLLGLTKEDIMTEPNTAEEIAEKLGFDVIDHGTHGHTKDACMSVDMLNQMMHEHTAQTLDRLKKRIENELLGAGMNPNEIRGVRSVLKLIEEVSDE